MCPAFTDGFIGQVLYFINRSAPLENQLQVDIIVDIKEMNKFTKEWQSHGAHIPTDEAFV